jgi:dipeptidyl-peptidase 4
LSYIKIDGEGAAMKMKLVLRDAASASEQEVPEPAGDHHLSLFSYQWSPQGDKLLVEGGSELWLMDLKGGEPRRLTNDGQEKESVTFSPAGDRVAFVEGNNVYTVDVAGGALKKLTTDGNENLMNGKLDWVYEEELLQRGTAPAYVWSPDGRKIAYLSLDDTPVPKYPLTHYLSDHVTLSDERFPQPGDPNPIPGMHVVSVSGDEPEIRNYPLKDRDVEYLSPDFTWTPDSKTVAFSTMNRHQNDLAVHLWDPESGADHLLVEEKDPYWINAIDAPYFLKNGRGFLWLSERDGWLHLYLYGMDGHLERQIGSGDWMIDRPTFANPGLGAYQVDDSGGWAYFLSTNPDPRERQVYRVRLETGEMQQLTRDRGTHGVELSPDGEYFIDNFSSVTTPPETRLLKSDGTAVATLNAMKDPWADYAQGSTEFVTVKAADGVTLYGRMVKPPGFDAAKKYPVLVDVYGGPDVQIVRNAWGVTGAEDQLYAENGYVIWSLDNRGSSGRGHAFESAIFEHMGQHEVEDQLAGINYLKSLPYIDGSRIGVHGWSYGGYMTLELLTHAPDVFKCGAAGGPVTAWKFYDSIYTERYMRTPQENPDGYRYSSPLNAADKIKGKLLLIHGTDDDNVHMQNTLNFVEALVKAQIPFELYLQPGERHGFASLPARLYLSERELAFFKANL